MGYQSGDAPKIFTDFQPIQIGDLFFLSLDIFYSNVFPLNVWEYRNVDVSSKMKNQIVGTEAMTDAND